MSEQEENVVNVKILERAYRIKCHPEQMADLEEAARYVSEQMRKIRQSSNVMSTDRVAIVTALNLCNELLLAKKQHNNALNSVKERFSKLIHHIDNTLAEKSSTAV